MYNHFQFKDGSNPYITKTLEEFWRILKKYNVEQIGDRFFLVHEERSRKNDYQTTKQILKDFAIEWSLFFNEYTSSYSDLIFYQTFFTTYGKRYGLLKEFKENAIC